MSEQLEVLLDVTERLKSQGIAYMVSGSMAMNQYAQPRMTRDIDIVVELQEKDAESFVKHFGNDYYVDHDMISQAIANGSMFNIIQEQLIVKVDFIIRKNTPYRELEFSRQIAVDLNGSQVSLVSAEDLILSKLEWAKESLSEMQMGDVENLLASHINLDWDYLLRWANELGVQEQLEKIAK